MKLNLGCGPNKLYDYVNVDIDKRFNPDVRWDLNKYPYPFKSNSAEEIFSEHCLEHLKDPARCFKEIYRILKPNAIFHLIVPHFSQGSTHFFHLHNFNYGTIAQVNAYMPEVKFVEIRKMRFNWTRQPLWYMQLLNYPLDFLANLHQGACDRIWCYWVGGFEEMDFLLRKGEVK